MSQKNLYYLNMYPESIQQQVETLIAQDQLKNTLLHRYPNPHSINNNRALFEYLSDIKKNFLQKSESINKVIFDSKIQAVEQTLGQHRYISRIQGSKLKVKHDIRIASIFKQTPEPFLKMIVVHELAHLKEKEHNKSFYQLCRHMESNYHQYELDLRIYLTHLAIGGHQLWASNK